MPRSKLIFVTAATVALCVAGAAGGARAADLNDLSAPIERQFRSGAVAAAFARIERAIAAQPNDPALRFLHGVMLSESGREAEAVVMFERLTQDFPELPEPFNNLAVLYAAQGRLDRSREMLEAALRNDPAYATALQNLGDVFARLSLRAYEAAARPPRGDDALQRKLRLVRELVGSPALSR